MTDDDLTHAGGNPERQERDMTNISPAAPLQQYLIPYGGWVEPHDAGMIYLRDDVDAAIATLAAERDALRAENERLREALAKIADGNPTVDSPEADAQLSAAIARAAIAAIPAVTQPAFARGFAAGVEAAAEIAEQATTVREDASSEESKILCDHIGICIRALSPADAPPKTEAEVRADERAQVIADAVAECRTRSLAASEEIAKNRADIMPSRTVKDIFTGRMVEADDIRDAIDALHTPASRAAAEKGGAA